MVESSVTSSPLHWHHPGQQGISWNYPVSMLILAINTASSRTAIALFESGPTGDPAKFSNPVPGNGLKLLASKSWQARNNEAEKLMPSIDSLLKIAAKKRLSGKNSSRSGALQQVTRASTESLHHYPTIRQIYVIKGPGSFTGLRVGITVANTIAHLVNAEIFAPSTFEYWHSQTKLPILIYAGSGGVYLSENPNGQPLLVNLHELNTTLDAKNIKIVTGDISTAQIGILKNVKFQKLKTGFAAAMTKMITRNFENLFLKPTRLVEPLYIKEPGITLPKTIAAQSN